MTETITIANRIYTVEPVTEDAGIVAEVFNSRGSFAGYLVRDAADASNYILAGSAFSGVNTRAAASKLGRELTA